mgnify:FL=1
MKRYGMKYAGPILIANYLINIGSTLWSYIEPEEEMPDMLYIGLSLGMLIAQLASLYKLKNSAAAIKAHNGKMLLGDMCFFILLCLAVMAVFILIDIIAAFILTDATGASEDALVLTMDLVMSVSFLMIEAGLIWLCYRSAKGLYLTIKNRPVSHKWI